MEGKTHTHIDEVSLKVGELAIFLSVSGASKTQERGRGVNPFLSTFFKNARNPPEWLRSAWNATHLPPRVASQAGLNNSGGLAHPRDPSAGYCTGCHRKSTQQLSTSGIRSVTQQFPHIFETQTPGGIRIRVSDSWRRVLFEGL